MTTEDTTQPTNRLCCAVSKAAGDDPAGSGSGFAGCLSVEIPPPWKAEVTASVGYPEGLRDAVERLRDAGLMGKSTALHPDPEYSREGHTRVLYLRRPHDGPFAAYEKNDYLVPDDELVPLVEAMPDPAGLAGFERYRQNTAHVRDILVCTHGSRDVCCGRFGYRLYNLLRSRYAGPDRLRVWRTSHIGGHRFAPTLLELPEGRYWGHLETGAVENLVLRNGPFSEVGRFYRGWAGFGSNFEQIAEREILTRLGWSWTSFLKEGRVLGKDENGDRADVRIDYISPEGDVSGSYEATVEADGSVMTLASSGTEPLEEAKQYRVSRLEKTT
jgi:hypothetical protein